jgi:hypothetical protein
MQELELQSAMENLGSSTSLGAFPKKWPKKKIWFGSIVHFGGALSLWTVAVANTELLNTIPIWLSLIWWVLLFVFTMACMPWSITLAVIADRRRDIQQKIAKYPLDGWDTYIEPPNRNALHHHVDSLKVCIVCNDPSEIRVCHICYDWAFKY